MRKYKPYGEYKDSGQNWIGQIPNHWSALRIGSVFDERREKVSDKDFKPLSVTKNGIVPQLENAAKSNDGDNRKGVRKGDFVINSRSDRKGSSGIALEDGSVSLINIAMKPNGIVPMFSEYLLKSNNFKEEFYRYGHGIVSDLWTTRFSDMKGILLPIPPIQEQTAIANFLEKKTAEIKEFIRLKEKTIELLKERKTAIINQAVTKGLDQTVPMRDSGIEWLGEIPEHWSVVPLRYLGRNQNGISKDSDYFGSGLPFVSYGDVYNNRVLPSQLKGLANSSISDRRTYSILKGDVIFTRTSETVEEIGFSSTCTETIENATFSGFLIRFRPYSGRLYDGFSKYFFRSNIHRKFFVREMNIVIRASLSQDLLKAMPVVLPTLKEQEAISVFLDSASYELDQSISQAQKEITLIKEYQENLISEAVTGKIDVSSEPKKELQTATAH